MHTFGCQMNVHDSDRMVEVLEAHGYAAADSAEQADVIVFNTCSVRERAEQKLRSEVGKLAGLKAAKPDTVLVVAGCVAQQEGDRLLSRVPYLDLVLGPDNIAELPQLIEALRGGSPPFARTVFDYDAPSFLAAAPRKDKRPAAAFVTTMKGCDERCSFCIVPYTRGSERYRPAVDVVAEIRDWVGAGTREITLLGQTVDSFRDPALPPAVSDSPDESQFPQLLAKIAREVPELTRLRYTSPHPRHLTPSLIDAHRMLPLLARHVHMPVQSGSDRMLRRMIRRYTRAEYIERITALREAVPGLTLSTDLIVGFPGETDEDFRATLSLVEEIGFVSLYAFKYSQRPFTPALKLGDDVPEAEKARRLAILLGLADRLTKQHLDTLVGSSTQVLVLGLSKSQPAGLEGRKMVQGRSERNEIVHFDVPADRDPIGQLLRVDLVRANRHSMDGKADPEALAQLPSEHTRVSRTQDARRVLPVLSSSSV
jgi:tRNA-2-methylthio-N6-dimethylallyladenosine synthase